MNRVNRQKIKKSQKQEKKEETKIVESKQTIFTSPNYETKKTVLLLIPNSGKARAGQWSPVVCTVQKII